MEQLLHDDLYQKSMHFFKIFFSIRSIRLSTVFFINLELKNYGNIGNVGNIGNIGIVGNVGKIGIVGIV